MDPYLHTIFEIVKQNAYGFDAQLVLRIYADNGNQGGKERIYQIARGVRRQLTPGLR
jgi:hypothetical protein